jgi:hypothetical protein
MSSRVRTAVGGLVGLAAVVLLAALSRAPQIAHDRDTGVLRLSWRAQPERIEVCRTVPEAELASLPRHMRQPVICAGHSAEYRLTVLRDGEPLADDTVHGSGARRDRPMYLYREFHLAPGVHDLSIRLERLRGDDAEDTTEGDPTETDDGPLDAAPQPGQRLAALPRVLDLSRRVRVLPRAVVLVTYDQERRELVVR